jgi:hypothetical protein
LAARACGDSPLATTFYLAKEGLDFKRIDLAELKWLIISRTISGDDLVFAKYLKSWTKIRHVKGFRTLIARIEGGETDSDNEAAKIFHDSEKSVAAKSFETLLPVTTDLPKSSSSIQGIPSKRPISFIMPSETTPVSLEKASETLGYIGHSKKITALLFILMLFVVIFMLRPSSGTERANVSGMVKFMGQPIESGKISFESPDSSAPGSNGEIVNGYFDLSGDRAPGTGNMVVRIWAVRKTGKKLDTKKLGPGMESFTGDLDEQEMYIPAKHNSASKLQKQISPGITNVFDFDLDGELNKK